MLRDLFSLFPAYAGVIPMNLFAGSRMPSFPRIRGGDPKLLGGGEAGKDFSPHTRG